MGLTLFRRNSRADTHDELGVDDLRRLLEIERGQRILLENAYEATVVALARALESKDSGTGAHSQRVQRYALECAPVPLSFDSRARASATTVAS